MLCAGGSIPAEETPFFNSHSRPLHRPGALQLIMRPYRERRTWYNSIGEADENYNEGSARHSQLVAVGNVPQVRLGALIARNNAMSALALGGHAILQRNCLLFGGEADIGMAPDKGVIGSSL